MLLWLGVYIWSHFEKCQNDIRLVNGMITRTALITTENLHCMIPKRNFRKLTLLSSFTFEHQRERFVLSSKSIFKKNIFMEFVIAKTIRLVEFSFS